jgi:small nuclear ribonucleoprotein B and B'
MTRQNKMLALVNSRVRITLKDGRVILGQLLAFDKYMNLVVADSEEHRKVKIHKPTEGADSEKQMERSLGLIVLRGENIISCCQETGAPSSGFQNKARAPAAQHLAPGMRPVPGQGNLMPLPAMMARPGMMPLMPPGMQQ